ncbi:uncharacterized protein LOC123966941 [Micropterus dolomieu]|uniref:uncharacterized protein LOC123966941 n=1 Tax=Micropterus dolomieu TaxID=147949 RepID=UPI001E8E220D|nr:uncharacterized protein LOC123966941 [Micropterus dolomieu]
MLGDNYSDLCKKREEFIKGEDIWNQTLKRKTKPNSRWMKDVEEEDERPTKQSFRIVTKLKEVIEKVTHQTSTSASNWSTPTASVDSPASACVSPEVVSDDMVSLVPGSDVKVPRRKLNCLRTANPSVYIGDLAVLVYGRETLSHSSLTGRQSGAHKDMESKPQLDNTKLEAIVGHALLKFPNISIHDVRRIIRKKCNNESYTKQATAKKTV